MFVWWDGKVNPCDVDYKSELSAGNIFNNNISELWKSKEYNSLRKRHLLKLREKVLSSPLFDTETFFKDFEKLLKDVIYNY